MLSTIGTWKAGFYSEFFSAAGFEFSTLKEGYQEHLNDNVLFNPEYEIKIQDQPVTEEARKVLHDGV